MPFECKSSCKYMVASRTMEMTPLIFQLFAFQKNGKVNAGKG